MKFIEITSKLGFGSKIICDDEDFEALGRYKWRLNKHGYVVRTSNENFYSTEVNLTRFLLGAKEGEETDHVNRNPLDNRRCNIRICSRSQNEANKPPSKKKSLALKGVYFARGKYLARVKHQGKVIHLGYFETPAEAARVYNEKAKQIWGEFAWLNPI